MFRAKTCKLDSVLYLCDSEPLNARQSIFCSPSIMLNRGTEASFFSGYHKITGRRKQFTSIKTVQIVFEHTYLTKSAGDLKESNC